jgi:hypothetical protein
MYFHVDFIIRSCNISKAYFIKLPSKYEIKNRVLLSFSDIDFLLCKLETRSYKTLCLFVFLSDLKKIYSSTDTGVIL